jgi:plasmid stabilization system protein ParE
MATYRLTTPASLDYVEILDNTLETWGIQQFTRYGQLLDDAFEKLAKNPEFGRHIPNTPETCLGYRIKSHVIFYQKTANGIDKLICI